MKRLIWLLLLGFQALAWPLYAQQVNVTIPNVTVPAGKDFVVHINTGDVTNRQVYSFEFTLAYDSNLMSALEVIANGTISAVWGQPTYNLSVPGQVVVAFGGTVPLSGSGTLISVRFHTLETAPLGATSNLTFVSFKFNEGNPPISLHNGSIVIGQDTDPPQFTATPRAISTDYRQATIRVRTNEPSWATIYFGQTEAYGTSATDNILSTSHAIRLTGLKETTTYHFKVEVTDSLNNGPASSPDLTFSTKAFVVSAPAIDADAGTQVQIPLAVTSVSGLNITQFHLELIYDPTLFGITSISTENTLLAQWPQPQVSLESGKVIIDATSSQPLTGDGGNLCILHATIPENAALNKSSSLQLSNVTFNGGDIRLRVQDGSLTVKDRIPPIILADPQVTAQGTDAVRIVWQTNEPASSMLQYGVTSFYTSSLQSGNYTLDHKMVVSGLSPGQVYHFRVGGTDRSGNGPVWSQDFTFQTQAAEVRAFLPDTVVAAGQQFLLPVWLSDISSYSVTHWRALLAYNPQLFTFQGIEKAGSMVAAWTDVALTQENGIVSLSATGSSLAGTGVPLIFFRFQSNNQVAETQISEIELLHFRLDDGWPTVASHSGQITVAANQDNRPPNISYGPFVDRITNTSARIFYRTDEPAIGLLRYGVNSTSENEVQESGYSTLHHFLVSNLAPGTSYRFQVNNRDAAGNESGFTQPGTFQSLGGESLPVDISFVRGNPGATVAVPITVGNTTGQAVYSLDMELELDTDLLTPITVESQNTLTSGWGDPVVTIDQSRIIVAMGGIQPLTGAGELLRLKVRVKADAKAGELGLIRFVQFTFNEGTPNTTVGYGGVGVNDTEPPRLQTGPVALQVQAKSAMVVWRTNEPTTASVRYGIAPPFQLSRSDGGYSRNHALLLADLSPETTYQYQITSKDTASNVLSPSQIYSFKTLALANLELALGDTAVDQNQEFILPLMLRKNDGRAPFSFAFDIRFDPTVLSWRSFSASGSISANWSWNSAAVDDSTIHVQGTGNSPLVQTGTLLNLTFKSGVAAYGTQTSIRLINISADGGAEGIVVTPGVVTVVDRTPPEFTLAPTLSELRAQSVVVQWSASEPTQALVEYGPESGQQETVKLTEYTTSASYRIENLSPQTRYKVRVGLIDQAGNGPTWSSEVYFTTPSGNEVDIVLPDTTVAIGDTVTIPLRIATIPRVPINGYRFKLIYDVTALNFLQISTEGSVTANWPEPQFSVQGDTITVEHSGTPGIQSAGTILQLQFAVNSATPHGTEIILQLNDVELNQGTVEASARNGILTCKDQKPPILVAGPSMESLTPWRAEIFVQLNEPSRVSVDYGINDITEFSVVDTALQTMHQLALPALQPNTLYRYRLTFTDSLGNSGIDPQIRQFQTPGVEATFTLPDTTVKVNSQVLVPVRISDVTGFGINSLEMDIHFESRWLTAQGISQEGSLLSNWPAAQVSFQGETIHVTASGDSSLVGSGVLFWLRFKISEFAPVADSTELRFENIIIEDGSIPTSFQNGKLTFAPGTITGSLLFALPEVSVYPDSLVDVPVEISMPPAFKLSQYLVLLSFDQNLLEFVRVETSHTLTQDWVSPVISLIGDTLMIAHSGANEITQSGTLILIRFRAKSTVKEGQTSSLLFIRVEVNNSTGQVTTRDGIIRFKELPHTIQGVVRNQRYPEEVVPGADVTLLDDAGKFLSQTQSDHQGFFEFTGLTPGATYGLVANKAGYSPSDTIRNVKTSRETLDLFLLKQDGVISGVVSDPWQKPVPNALLTAADDFGHFGSANTDSTGAFQITNLDRRFRYSLRVTSYGFYDVALMGIPVDTTLTIQLNYAYGTIYGMTTDTTGNPLDSVLVKVKKVGIENSEIVRMTGPDGRYQIDSLVAGNYEVSAFKQGLLARPQQIAINLAPEATQEANFVLKPFSLTRVQITGYASIPNNRNASFSYTALSEQQESVPLFQPQWGLVPSAAGTISSEGILTPNPHYIGLAQVLLREGNTSIADTFVVSIYAPVSPADRAELTNGNGVELIIPEGALADNADIVLETARLLSIRGANKKYDLVGQGYDFKPDNLSFQIPVILRLPVPEEFRRETLLVAQWNKEQAEWRVLANSVHLPTDQIEAKVDHFSLFALVKSSRPLGIYEVSFHPNPFSPDYDTDGDGRPGVAIHFVVSSNRIRQPFVTVKIYSVLGELVRKLKESVPVDKGSEQTWYWDGKTDFGRLARNGRYLVKLEVSDGEETKTFLGKVVLIR